MALPQAIVYGVGGTVEIQLPVRPDSSPAPTVTVYGPDGTAYASAQSATVDSVNTTISSGLSTGETTIAVTSATGVVIGGLYLVGDGASSPKEFIRVRTKSSNTLTLARPIRYGHSSSDPFVGTKLSYAVTAAQASATFFGGYARWTWTESTVTRQDETAVECTRTRLIRLATWQDLHIRDAKFYRKIDTELDVDELLVTAFDDSLDQLGITSHARALIGSNSMIRPTVYRALMLAADNFGRDYEYLRDRYKLEWEIALSSIQAAYPADNNQDGTIDATEGLYRSIRFQRTG